MLAPAVQRNFHFTELFREKGSYFTLLIVFLSLLLAAVVEYGRATHELPRL